MHMWRQAVEPECSRLSMQFCWKMYIAAKMKLQTPVYMREASYEYAICCCKIVHVHKK